MFKWENFIPPDKSFFIRAVLFSLLTDEDIEIEYSSEISEDALSSISMIKSCGKKITYEKNKIILQGTWSESNPVLNAENSATAMRIILGIACHLRKPVTVTGDKSLFSRDHSIFIKFMKEFGAELSVTEKTISVKNFSVSKLKKEITLPVQSAQLKTFLIFLLLKTGGKLVNCGKTRNYTEEILNRMGAQITTDKNLSVNIKPLNCKLKPCFSVIPKDASALFIALTTAISAQTEIYFNDIIIDETRIEPFNILKKSGYRVDITSKTLSFQNTDNLKNEKIFCNREEIPQIIDEIPFLAFLVPLKGCTLTFEDTTWLKNKESDRVTETIKRISAFFKTELKGETLTIYPEKAAKPHYFVHHSSDHRMEMLSAITALYRNKNFVLNGSEKISFPLFSEFYRKISVVKKINRERAKLNILDFKIMTLLEQRFLITDAIQQIKKEEHIDKTDPSRESAVLAETEIFSNCEKIKDIYKNIFKNSKLSKKR